MTRVKDAQPYAQAFDGRTLFLGQRLILTGAFVHEAHEDPPTADLSVRVAGLDTAGLIDTTPEDGRGRGHGTHARLVYRDLRSEVFINTKPSEAQEYRIALETVQDVFENVAFHLVHVLKGERSYNTDIDACAYRGSGGLKCAVGALIPDSTYTEALEGHTVFVDGGIVASLLRNHLGVPYDALDFLEAAQRLHDAGLLEDTISSSKIKLYGDLTPGRRRHLWRRTLIRYANRNGLTVPSWLVSPSAPAKEQAA